VQNGTDIGLLICHVAKSWPQS